MDHRIQHLHQQALLPKIKKPNSNTTQTTSFQEVFKDAQRIQLSKHAKERLTQRNIQLDASQWEKISQKIEEAKQKGVTDSLVLTNSAALLVSTKNNVVVTAMDLKEASSKIFTNINGTIVIDE
ncbi:TIGR02530 family flagellar biosynthesis protein [Aquibacillus albus]|uniref:Flagellar operon protein n=1 Tax=Aquibacillus albus TaxID=1168171 RepID=A0ABS2N109_9BACI|nr:TIGR02530 family flagellar biosynthesis protein [Aquibacillus albus]MBM7571826.1 flagellar operon protein [Aquibacillus albus]